MPYSEEEYLLLSGIQHFAFCRRQWALIHIEQQWQENLRTVEGAILHEKAHSELFFEKRNDLVIVRALAVASAKLGFTGVCDVVEFHSDDSGVKVSGREGKYRPVPVEYKRGKPKEGNCDALQLCAQAMCLEEMLVCEIPKGYLFYGETKRRLKIAFDGDLRREVIAMAEEMHALFRRRHTPLVKTGSFCRSCSLRELCLPKLCKPQSVSEYIAEHTEEKA